MDDRDLAELIRDELAHQDGVATWPQLVAHGARQHDRERWVRRRLLVPVHRAVYVAHTGPLTDSQRLWAAVLACGPGAALCLIGRPGPLVHVAIDATRRIAAPAGVRLHRVRDLDVRVRWSASPPRLRPQHDVLLGVALAVDEEEVVRVISDAVRTRVTTAARLREVVGVRRRLRHRRLVLAVLDDVERGIHSVLERRYLRHVERAHGPPPGTWQQRRRVDGRTEYADVDYEPFTVTVELDGRAGHEGWDAENRDARRDLDQAAEGWRTVRLRHRQVFREVCGTAVRLGRLLRTRGWEGAPRPCGPGCAVDAARADGGLRDEAG